ncbi:Concanavalin A-like lectin/glucanases superfamily [uncultured Caudovirales phage]|uniref:Concanavalin A-like lectin/glucanases superfamily n=1 Tax=uncultured Caudovirales phage TaxID=2100421 RepID=A0A6J5L318_9CAUD|nr:Concanavalin A-like lectin/glucanases superfamily [uncultured Caudovirales phage]
MSLNNTQLLLASDDSTTADTYKITNSLRFRSSASAYLNRTPASASSTTTWTISFWIKLSDLASSVDIFSAGGAGTETELRYGHNTAGSFSFSVNGTTTFVSTTALRRDPSSWYHIVVVANTTSATSTERFKLYVNNELQTFTAATQPAQNTSMGWNSNVLHYIGRRVGGTSYFDGYITEFYSIDGQALTPSSFGAAHPVTGVWRPKAYAGTYGTNGFYLPFTDSSALTTSSNAGLGKDFSGNGNYWVTNNISITAGETYDSMTDVPTLTSATAGNYPVFNVVDGFATAPTFNSGNLTFVGATGQSWARSNMAFPNTGKWYVEAINPAAATTTIIVGLVLDTLNPSTTGAISTNAAVYGYDVNGNKIVAGTSSAYGATWALATDVIGIAFDADAGTLTMYKNNISQGTLATGLTGTYYFVAIDGNATNARTVTVNFGQRPFNYTPPTGYKALNTYNLPDPAVGTTLATQPNKFMDVTLYTGDNTTPRSIANTSSFKPDFVWIKNRVSTGNWHQLYDSVRGATKSLSSNNTNAEVTNDANGYLSAFNSNGFAVTTGSTDAADTNATGSTYVGWQWQAGQGTTSSNTSGSITSTVSVNATAGFSIVTYTGTGANATVGHGLGVAPKMIICKNRSVVTSWNVYHTSLGNTQALLLNSTAVAATSSTYWNNTSPTSTVFSISTDNNANGSGNSQVAYCWAEIDGFSKIGSAIGNGSADGKFIYLGFKPKFIICRQSTVVDNWLMIDIYRDTINVAYNQLSADSSAAESTVNIYFDILSNGIKWRTTNMNNSGAPLIYMAFAENPFKYALAR